MQAMTSKERVLTALRRCEPDRVPINYSANPGIHKRLLAHFGLAPGQDAALRAALGVDFLRVRVPYTGPRLHAEIPDRQVDPAWGRRKGWIAHGTGGYWEFCDFPLKDADEEAVERWPMPNPDHFDYSGVADFCRKNRQYAILCGEGPDIINSTGMWRTMEQTLVDLALDEPACLWLIDRKMEIVFEITRRTIEASRGGVDVFWMGEDLGTQTAPLISMDLYRRHIKPRHARFTALAKAHGMPVLIHSCGSSSWAFEDFIEIGIDGVDTLQPEAARMQPEYLKKTFGDRLAFHGGISTAGPVAFSGVSDVISDCRKKLEIFMPGGGYCFAPTHQLQDNSPTENVVAMYQTALQYGQYR
jgi:uroporphyrinogen decarboxylase